MALAGAAHGADATSATITVGARVTLTASADGNPAPTFQWKKNGTVIPGATNVTFTILAAALTDAGTYQVIATNSAGSAVSHDAVLTVQSVPSTPPQPITTSPVFTVQPLATYTVAAGATVELKGSASGSPAPTYQWKKNGVNVAGATGSSLTLTNVTTTHSGAYTLIATNSAGWVSSNTAQLVVTEPVVTPPPPSGGGSTPTVAAPVFVTQPISTQNVGVGSKAVFAVAVTGSPTPTLQWRKDGLNVAGATAATFTINSVTENDVGIYTAVASNAGGSVVSSSASLVVATVPKILQQPSSTSALIGAPAHFTVAVSGSPTPKLQWLKNGAAISGATGTELVIASVASADAGLYRVVASNAIGGVTSTNAELKIASFDPNATLPQFTAQPVSQAASVGGNVSFSVAAAGTPAPTLQWRKNGIDIPGATGAALSLKSISTADAGAYSVVATNVMGFVTSVSAELTVSSAPDKNASVVENGNTESGISDSSSRVVNLSVRAAAGAGNDSLIVGFVVSEGASKPVLVRGIGPMLGAFGVPGTLQDPMLSLYSGSAMTASNDDWTASDAAAQIVTTTSKVGAFALPESGGEAALISTVNAGAYTVQVNGKGSGSGIALVEVYDAAAKTASRLVNVSTRTRVGTGAEVPNIGFVIEGTTSKTVLIRAVGPTLAAFGVGGVLADPQLELYQGAARVQHNDNWGGGSGLTSAFSKVGAFGLADGLSKDAVLLVTLEPGAYTAVVSGVGGTTGVVLVEVYDIP